MRRLFTLLILALLSCSVFAQERIALLDKASGKRVSFAYRYFLIQDGKDGDEVTSGRVSVQGNAFRLDGLGLEIVSDGTTRWTMDSASKELLIETVDGDDLLTNPALLVLDYRHHPGLLKVRKEGPDSLDVEVHLDERTAVHLIISGVTFNEEGPLSDFVLEQASLDKDYVVTDLR